MADKIPQEVERWKKVAEAVRTAAKGVETLADILAKALSAGLLGIQADFRTRRSRKGTRRKRC